VREIAEATRREVGALAMDPESGPRTSSIRASGARRPSGSRPRASSPPSAWSRPASSASSGRRSRAISGS